MKQLNELVEELLKEFALLQVGFDAQAIRQHILDILSERRRSVRKGHDNTKVYSFCVMKDVNFRGMGLKEAAKDILFFYHFTGLLTVQDMIFADI